MNIGALLSGSVRLGRILIFDIDSQDMITQILHEKRIVDCIVAVIAESEFYHPAIDPVRSAFETVISV